MQAEYYRQRGDVVDWGNAQGRYDKIISEPEGLPFLELPAPDRIFTRAKEYTSGNYKHLPGTHILAADGCWHGRCRFCVENGKPYQVRPVDDVIAEIEECRRLGFRDIFDDSGTFPIGGWLDDFCKRLEKIPICFSCNFRAIDYDYRRLRKAGFRMLLVGVESANDSTLQKIQKGITVEDAKKNIIKAARAGLDVHISAMVGYPWETDEDAQRTLKLVHYLLRKGYAKTAQASFYTVGGLQYNLGHKRFVNKIYNAAFYPSFWFNKIKDIKNIDDIRYIWRGIKAALKR